MPLHELAGKPAPYTMLVNIPRLVSDYYTITPDSADPVQRVAFGTSGHRGTSTTGRFNAAHIAAIAQAICDYRQAKAFRARSIWAWTPMRFPSRPRRPRLRSLRPMALNSSLPPAMDYTPTPVISHAILTYNRDHDGPRADGVVITPSHNPPTDGGFKYNPPIGRPG